MLEDLNAKICSLELERSRHGLYCIIGLMSPSNMQSAWLVLCCRFSMPLQNEITVRGNNVKLDPWLKLGEDHLDLLSQKEHTPQNSFIRCCINVGLNVVDLCQAFGGE